MPEHRMVVSLEGITAILPVVEEEILLVLANKVRLFVFGSLRIFD